MNKPYHDTFQEIKIPMPAIKNAQFATAETINLLKDLRNIVLLDAVMTDLPTLNIKFKGMNFLECERLPFLYSKLIGSTEASKLSVKITAQESVFNYLASSLNLPESMRTVSSSLCFYSSLENLTEQSDVYEKDVYKDTATKLLLLSVEEVNTASTLIYQMFKQVIFDDRETKFEVPVSIISSVDYVQLKNSGKSSPASPYQINLDLMLKMPASHDIFTCNFHQVKISDKNNRVIAEFEWKNLPVYSCLSFYLDQVKLLSEQLKQAAFKTSQLIRSSAI